MRKVCIVTGTRAEYGLLKPLIAQIDKKHSLELQIVATGAHLSPEFGLTYREIEQDGYKITAKIEMLLSSDSAVGITKSMGVALLGFADYYEVYRPDIVVILGDRYEMLMAASAALVANIPIAHIHGGELTEGAIDDAIRHSITKMSQLHFTATQEYRRRVIQLGEQPENVYNVGALGVENTKCVPLLSKKKLEQEMKFLFSENTVLVTFHPVTLENMTAKEQFGNLLAVLREHKEIKIIFTKANSDTGGRIINQMIDEFVLQNKENCAAHDSLGQVKYLSALQFCKAVIGNSSSGIIEVPSFGIPTVNIGDRQKGRICAESVISCGSATDEIRQAIQKALSDDMQKIAKKVQNPYEGENTSETIIKVIEQSLEHGIHIKKEFYNIEHVGE